MASRPVDHKRFELRRVLRPFTQGGLSSTVLIDGGGHVNVGFSIELVRRAGTVLPRGISQYDPAYMTLKYDIKQEKYKLFVQYLKDPQQHLLLIIPDRPTWLRMPKSDPLPLPRPTVPRPIKELS